MSSPLSCLHSSLETQPFRIWINKPNTGILLAAVAGGHLWWSTGGEAGGDLWCLSVSKVKGWQLKCSPLSRLSSPFLNQSCPQHLVWLCLSICLINISLSLSRQIINKSFPRYRSQNASAQALGMSLGLGTPCNFPQQLHFCTIFPWQLSLPWVHLYIKFTQPSAAHSQLIKCYPGKKKKRPHVVQHGTSDSN